ncbi:MAG: winged helix-turn-helix domain-containing protein, partial [Acidobacteria bacterium]|nr:winged helix-turn-helix domain-containing protein [Acidobacteriota bacterium]
MAPDKTLYYEFGSCRLDVENHELINRGESIFLAQKTFEILCYFVQNAGRVLRKEELLDKFWEEEYFEETNLAQQIYRIRKAVRDEQTGDTYLETLRKYGYRFTAEVNEIQEAAVSNDTRTAPIQYRNGNHRPEEITSGDLIARDNGRDEAQGQSGEVIKGEDPPGRSRGRKFGWLLASAGVLLLLLLGYYYQTSNGAREFS